MDSNGSRRRASARLRLTVSYAGFLVVAGALVLAIAYVVLRTFPNYPLTAANPRDERNAPSRQVILDTLVGSSLLALAVLAVVGMAGGWILAGQVLRPLKQINRAATTAAAGDWNHRVNYQGPGDEFGQLADAFDHMLDQLQRSYEAQERFAANASHELRTPLTLTATLLDVARRNPSAQDYPALVARLSAANRHAIDLTEAILRLTEVNEAAVVDDEAELETVVAQSLDLMAGELAATEIDVQVEVRPIVVRGDSVLIGQLVLNLVQNAVRHNVRDGFVRIIGTTRGGYAVLELENGGVVRDPEVVAHLTEPFLRAAARTRDTGQHRGYGLGLAIANQIAELHGGTLALESRQPEGGLRLTVTLPLAQSAIGGV